MEDVEKVTVLKEIIAKVLLSLAIQKIRIMMQFQTVLQK